MRSFLTRLISALSIITITAGYLISAARHEEIYIMAAVAPCAELGANVPGAALGQWGFALLWLVLSFAFVVASLGSTMALDLILLMLGSPEKILLRLSAVSHCAFGIILGVGLLSVQERHNHLSSGFDKVSLNPCYFIVPTLLLVFGFIYFLLGLERSSPRLMVSS